MSSLPVTSVDILGGSRNYNVDEYVDVPFIGLVKVTPHYQPKVHLFNGDTRTLEALFRGYDIEGRLHGPWDVFPLIDRETFDDLVLKVDMSVVRQVEKWKAEGTPISVGFNGTERELTNRSLIETMKGMIGPTNPEYLTYEIVENVDLSKLTLIEAQNLRGIHDLGVRLAADDVGKGKATPYAISVAYQRYGVYISEVKTDCSVMYMDKHPVRPEDFIHVLRGYIIDCLEINDQMKFVVEGVETKTQLDALRDFVEKEFRGVNVTVQSFLTGKPMLPEELDLKPVFQQHQLATRQYSNVLPFNPLPFYLPKPTLGTPTPLHPM